ncbi:extensin [Gracilaria domingensis]|nr:extensin [Gracilaria domingensis]
MRRRERRAAAARQPARLWGVRGDDHHVGGVAEPRERGAAAAAALHELHDGDVLAAQRAGHGRVRGDQLPGGGGVCARGLRRGGRGGQPRADGGPEGGGGGGERAVQRRERGAGGEEHGAVCGGVRGVRARAAAVQRQARVDLRGGAGRVGGADRVLRGAAGAAAAERGRADAGGGRVHAEETAFSPRTRQRAAGVPRAGAHRGRRAQHRLGAGAVPRAGRRGRRGRVDQRAGGGGVPERVPPRRPLCAVERAAAAAAAAAAGRGRERRRGGGAGRGARALRAAAAVHRRRRGGRRRAPLRITEASGP